MKARTLIITAVAMFAIAAPAAQASLDRILPAKATFAKHHTVAATKVSKSHAATKPLYIYFPGTANQTPSTSTGPTDQELCDIYAMNCDTVVSTSTTAVAQAEVAPVEIAANDTSSSQSAPVASSASDPSMDASAEDC